MVHRTRGGRPCWELAGCPVARRKKRSTGYPVLRWVITLGLRRGSGHRARGRCRRACPRNRLYHATRRCSCDSRCSRRGRCASHACRRCRRASRTTSRCRRSRCPGRGRRRTDLAGDAGLRRGLSSGHGFVPGLGCRFGLGFRRGFGRILFVPAPAANQQHGTQAKRRDSGRTTTIRKQHTRRNHVDTHSPVSYDTLTHLPERECLGSCHSIRTRRAMPTAPQ